MSEQPVRARNTRQRAIINALLGRTEEFMTAQALHAQLRNSGESIGLATVYRTLQAMQAAGQVDTIYTPEGEIAYRQCSSGHHHHLICKRCGKAVEIEDFTWEDWANKIAAVHGFTDPDHFVEIFGICASCAEIPQDDA